MEYQKILVVNLMYIGDALFSTPLLRVLRTEFPTAHIDMLVDANAAAVLKYNPALSETIIIDKRREHKSLPNIVRLINDLRQRKYDLVINLHASERASVIAGLSGGKHKIGFSARALTWLFDQTLQERTDIHQADAYLEVLNALKINNHQHQGLELWLDQASQQKANEFWDTNQTSPIIGINTGGSWPTKRWTESGFSELADCLLEQGCGVAFFGGPMDIPMVNAILEKMKHSQHPRLQVFTGKTTLLETAALIEKCEAFVSGDSGPMHMAVAQKVPVIAIFGPSDERRYHPYSSNSIVVKSEDACRPCGKHACQIGHRCMTQVSPHIVRENIYGLIGRPRK